MIDRIQDEGHRQLVLLALAELALSRPGFDYAVREIAKRLQGEEMFDAFKRTSADRVKESHKPL
jgi:hypothetical protein